jgi:phage/plasmid primase-like uncharacterized protein
MAKLFPAVPAYKEAYDNFTRFEIIEKFKDAAEDYGLRIGEVHDDSEIHRCATDDKPRSKNGAYCLWIDDGVPAGWFQNWRLSDGAVPWCLKSAAEMTIAESRRHKETVARKAAEREANQELMREAVVVRTEEIWGRASSNFANHPYLKTKKIKKHHARLFNGALQIPLFDADGELVNIQSIFGNGEKRNIQGGQYSAIYSVFGNPNDAGVIRIGEGFSTCASIHEATGDPVYMSVTVENLVWTAQHVKRLHPSARIIICGDDDRTRVNQRTKQLENIGRIKAHEAARACLGDAVFPVFPEGSGPSLTDFNDMAGVAGIDVVKAVLNEQKQEKQAEWAEPGVIDAPLYPVVAFDARTLIPDVLREFVIDAAYRMPCAPDYIAASVIVALGSVIGARCGIKPKRLDDWIVVPNLWGGVVGDPSQKKSPGISEGMKPLGRLIARAAKEHKEAQGDAELEKIITEAKRDDLQKKLKGAAKGAGKEKDIEGLKDKLRSLIVTAEADPVMRRYKTNDSTVEKLGELLRANPNGILVQRDELVGLLASWDRAGHEGDRSFFLEAWNGTDSFDTDRIQRGEIFIPNLCLSVFGGIQPDKLTGYLEQASNALANDGMLQRLQVLVYPDPVRWEYRDAIPDKTAREQANNVFEKLDEFDPVEWGATPASEFVKFSYFQFSPDAQEIYIEFSTNLHRNIETEDSMLIRQHLAKYDKLFPALALVLHLAECASADGRGPVSTAAALRAAAWCQYLESHARRCYGLVADEGLRSARELAKHLALPISELPKNFKPEDFTLRDVRRNQWRYLTADEAVQAALDWLEDEGWVRSRKAGSGGKGGRPTYRYEVNPAVRPAEKAGGSNG